MAIIATQVVTSSGLAATYNAASAGGDKVAPHSIVHVKNANASACTVTLVTPQTVEGDLAVADRTVSVPATTGERFIAVPADFRGSDGLVDVTWSVTATVTFAVVRS